MSRTLLGLMCALGVAACAAPPTSGGGDLRSAGAPPPASLHGTRWVGVVPGGDPRTLPRLEFVAAGRVSGYTGCNMLSGTWKAEGHAAIMGPLVTTKRMCLGPEGEVEKRFNRALAIGSRVAREGDKLVATAPDGARFEFVEAAAS
jgi:heat shock protein HslJ